MAPLAAILANFITGFIAHKSSSALGVTAAGAALAVPSIANPEQIVLPSSIEEAVLQLVLGVAALVLMYFNPEKKK